MIGRLLQVEQENIQLRSKLQETSNTMNKSVALLGNSEAEKVVILLHCLFLVQGS